MSYYKHGDWNAICDVCGFKFKASQLRKRWDGFMVCDRDFESRHPSDFLRVKATPTAVPWTRHEAPDVFLDNVQPWEQLAYADLGTADRMKADYAPGMYWFYVDLKQRMGL